MGGSILFGKPRASRSGRARKPVEEMEARWIGSASHSVRAGLSVCSTGRPQDRVLHNTLYMFSTLYVLAWLGCLALQGDWSRASTVKPVGCEVGATIWAQVWQLIPADLF